MNLEGSLIILGVEDRTVHEDSHEKPALRYSNRTRNESKQKQGSWLEGSCMELQRERQKRLDLTPGCL